MCRALVFLSGWLCAAEALAVGPNLSGDPFEDADFIDAPLILDVANPSRGRGELSLWFTGSLLNKYTSHRGAMLAFEYFVTDTLGVAFDAGWVHGTLTPIVTDDAGIIGNKVQKCVTDTAACSNVNPKVPDYNQITGTVDLLVVWAPLYGKMNVVSELDANIQGYVVGGGGVNGTRQVKAVVEGTPAGPEDYDLQNNRLGDGGFLNAAKVHGTIGVGLQVFMLNWLSLRGEARGLIFRDSFDFDNDGTVGSQEGYFSQYWFFQAGLGLILF